LYWLAMPFFSPIPVEADRFYARPGMAEKNLNFDWYPVGSGPYMLTVNDPNRQMVLERNPNFVGERYPDDGPPGGGRDGILRDAGKPMPFIERVVYSLEKEQIPYWNKFIQGYYDASGISSDNFDQVIQLSGTGDAHLTPEMESRGIRLQTSVAPSIMYIGFNMLDPLVGGDSERARKLRQAISIAIDQEEYISIFRNGRGVAAQGPIPPGIIGYKEGEAGINRYVYEWKEAQPQRRSIEYARQLLAEAGYPDGMDRASGKPLIVHFDSTATGVGAKAQTDWLIKQFQKINVQLVMRATDYNRFQEKMRKGTAQLYYWGWNADYPDPENFLFLFHGHQGKVKGSGENASNYANPEYDRLFARLKTLDDGPEKQRVIDEMTRIAQQDAPWTFGYFPFASGAFQPWVHNGKPAIMIRDMGRYYRLDVAERQRLQAEWNRPVWWPLFALAVAALALVAVGWRAWVRRERTNARGEVLAGG
jgi:ABC-type transport system substrate-binding protein